MCIRDRVNLLRTENGTTYVFRHPFNDDRRVYYRIAIANANNQVVAYTPAVQVLEEEHTVKIFPTQVRGGNFYIQTGQPYEKLQVVNSANQSVYEKGINNVTGTINISLPSLPTGIYFVRLLSPDRPQHVQRIMVE